MRCIVTGGTGFIGSHLAEELTRRGHEVTVIDLRPGPWGARHLSLDINDVEGLADAFKTYGPDGVFHLAAISDARAALNNPLRAVELNVSGTAGVLEAARRADIRRVLFASTVWVYNAAAVPDGDDPLVLTEDVPISPDGGGHVYTTTKINGELLCRDYQRLYGLDSTIFRYGIPYGTRMWPGLALRAFFERALRGEPIQIFGDGTATRYFVHVKDMARAQALAFESDGAAGQVYNLEGNRAVAIRELAELVCDQVPGATIHYVDNPERRGELNVRDRVISNAKARRELGWTPEITIEQGVADAAPWYAENLAKTA